MTVGAAWQPMTGNYLNGWVDYGGAYLPGGYLVDLNGLVYLRGTIKSGTIGQPCFVLPAPFRPGALVEFAATSNGLAAYVQIDTSGNIKPLGGSNLSFDLNGVYFDSGATMGDVAWTAPTLINSWAAFTPALPPSFFKDSVGIIHLRGAIKSGALGTIAFTLPVGYRPTAITRFAVASNGAFGEVDVSSAGDVSPVVGSTAVISLDGITFDTR